MTKDETAELEPVIVLEYEGPSQFLLDYLKFIEYCRRQIEDLCGIPNG